MKIFRKTLIAVAGTASLLAPLSIGAVAHASVVQQFDVNLQTVDLQCQQFVQDGEISFTERNITEGCDLGIDKQVSINGSAFVEADTSAMAAQAHVGDSVTWKITVTNTSSDQTLKPYGNLTVEDVLPSGVAFDSYTASSGTYTSNNWTFALLNNLPATLTIASHSTATGLFQNTATLSAYDPCSDGCSGAGPYADSNPDNNSDDAWIDPSAPPQVLAASTTLTNTGSGTMASLAAAGLLVITGGALVLARRSSTPN